MNSFILGFCIVNTLSTAGLAWLMFTRRLKKTELSILLDAMDLTRDHVDAAAKHTHDEHKALTTMLSTISGRVQFMMARDIAEEIAAEKQAQKFKAAAEAAQVLDMPL